jgi:hypothetical protein
VAYQWADLPSKESYWLYINLIYCRIILNGNWSEGPPLWSSGQSFWLQNGDVLCFLWGTNWIYISYVEESRPPLWSSGQSSWLVLCFLWGTNWIYVSYVEESRPPLWSSGQSSWLQIQGSVFDSRRCQFFWEVVSLEQGPLSLVSTIEELLGRKSSGSGLEIRECGYRDHSRGLGDTLYPQKLALTSPTSDGRSVRIVRSRTQATEFLLVRGPSPSKDGRRGGKYQRMINILFCQYFNNNMCSPCVCWNLNYLACVYFVVFMVYVEATGVKYLRWVCVSLLRATTRVWEDTDVSCRSAQNQFI